MGMASVTVEAPSREGLGDWLDRQAGRLFVLPAVLIILAFSIFPLVVSAWLSLSRFQLAPGGYQISYIGWLNIKKLFFGSQQFHLLGTFTAVSWFGGLILAATTGLLLWMFWRYFKSGRAGVVGSIGRLITAATALWIAWIFAVTVGDKGQLGSLSTTIIYVIGGVVIQFLLGLGLALLCA
jgi:multiple sugar transport system permease protein